MPGNVLTATIKVNTPGVKKAFDETTKGIKIIKTELKGVGFDDFTEKTKSLVKGTNEANVALINTGRVLQDLPFGIIGVANNINPLLESFQRLKASTGSTGSALKALGSSLIGGGGLGLAVSAVSALATFASIGLQAFSRSAGSAAKTITGAKSDFEEFKDTLDSVSNSLGANVSKVTFFFAALNSGSLNIGQRTTALKELKAVNEEFFGSLRDEKGLVDALKSAYDGYINNLLAVGRTKAIETELTKLFSKKLQLELAIDPKFLNATSKDVQKELGGLRKLLQQLGGPVDIKAPNFNPLDKALQRRISLLQRIRELEQGETRLIDAGDTSEELNKVNLQIKGLTALLGNIGNFGDIKATETKGKIKEAFEQIKAGYVEGLNDLVKTVELTPSKLSIPFQVALDENKLTIQFSALNEQLRAKLKQFELRASSVPFTIKQSISIDPNITIPAGIRKDTIEKLRSIFPTGTPLEFEDIEVDGKVVVNAKVDIKEVTRQLNQQIADTVRDLQVNIATSVGEAIGNAISGVGEARDAFKAVFDFLGEGIKAIGVALIKIGALSSGIQKALAALSIQPELAITLGIAFVALSQILKNSFNPREKGGPVQKGKLYEVNERGREIFQTNSGKPYLITGGRQFFTPPVSGKIIPHHQTEKILNSFKTTKVNSTRVMNSVSNSIKNFSGYRAGGGAVVAGNSYIVNERGAEIFLPNTGQSIKVHAPSGSITASPVRVEVFGRFVQSGKDMIATIANAGRSQGRLT